jgi:FMN phosphatase YigB (HAD superfamily)
VNKKDALSLWTDDAPLKKQLTEYISKITDKDSKDFIPVDRRIAVFDFDGTLFCETDPVYFDYRLFYYRVTEDPDYKDKASAIEKETAAKIKTMMDTGESAKGLEVAHGKGVASAFAGMTVGEFNDYVKMFREKQAPSYNNMKNGEAYYKPMIQVVNYLKANDFTVYVVSGTDRFIVRGAIEDSVLDVPPRQIIGSDETIVASHQGSEDGLTYQYKLEDQVITGGDFIIKNLKMNKVSVIQQEIGLQPVLSFGNSSGDNSMANFVIDDNPYPSAAYMLCCDDLERENGNMKKADAMRKSCEENGWTAISMKNDWTTIYGDNVTKK